MAAFLETSKVIGQVKDVRNVAWEYSKACSLIGPGFQDLCNDIRNLYCDLRALGEDLASPKSFLKRCDHHTEIELCELMEECKDDLQEVAEFLSNLSSQRRNSAIRSDRDLQGFHKKICDRTESLREFLAQATFAGLENMKAQLFMLVEDISSARRPPYVLRKIVDWDALADELGQPASADPKTLMLEEGDSNASHGGFIELPDHSAANSHSVSPQRPHTEVSNTSKKAGYRQPTVEDWVEGGDDVLPSPAILPMSLRNYEGAVDPHSHESNPKSSQGETPALQQKVEEDPMAEPSRKPRRVDTETRLMQEEKLTMKEEIRKLKEQAERYEELKLVAEFHTFCANFSRADEAAILAESWRIPPASFNSIAYFVMPSGETYSSSDLKHNNTVHSTPPLSDAVRRGSLYASHASGGGSGGVSSGGSTSIASPFRRDSAIFSELKGQSRREGSLDLFYYHVSKVPDAETTGLGIAGERDGRWARIAESPRQMSPVSDERTSTPLRPPPKPTPQCTPPLTPRPADVITKPLAVTLEEVFHGTEKRVRIDRQIVDVWTGSTRTEPKQLKVPIKPGLKAGSKIKFAGAGSQGMDGVAQDIWFILEDKRHSIFKRTGSDLEATLALTYGEAMFGWRKEIWTICGRKIRIKGPKNTPSDWRRIYHGFGMPRSSDTSKRGDLIVNVDIQAIDHPRVI